MLQNLILNAIEAIADGASEQIDPDGSAGTVTVCLSTKDPIAVISVEDTGPGLTEDTIKNLYEPFYTTRQKGTGLGLPICQQIVQDHGGEMSVVNNPDRGATFFVTLPYAGQEDTRDGPDSGS